jgi:formate dehydrogenase iron-sulfur subunit
MTAVRAAPSERSVRRDAERYGFFTDTTVCIGCKACEVACKQWNDLPGDGGRLEAGRSYDHTLRLSASTWRHVRFIEEPAMPTAAVAAGDGLPDLVQMAEAGSPPLDKWLFMSDVCKHCTNAGCMDACPTGAIIRTEFDTVVIQADVCNGCGYCIPSCPFGVPDRDPEDGRAAKCTLCYDRRPAGRSYDRLVDGLEPACAKACPTDSIIFGEYEWLVETAKKRVATLHDRGIESAYLYGAGDPPEAELAGGLGAFFLLTQPPERYGLPANAESPIQENVGPATAAGIGAGLLAAAGVAVAFLVRPPHAGRRERARAKRWSRGG